MNAADRLGQRRTAQPEPVNSLSDVALDSLIDLTRHTWLYLLVFQALAHISEPKIRSFWIWKLSLILNITISAFEYYLNVRLSDRTRRTGWWVRAYLLVSPVQCLVASAVIPFGYALFGFDRTMIAATFFITICACGCSFVLRANYRVLRATIVAWFLPPIIGAIHVGGTNGYEVAVFVFVMMCACLRQGKLENQTFWRLLHANRELELARKKAEASSQLEAELLADRMYQEGIVAERTRIAAELHDTLSAGFSAIKLQIDVAANSLTAEPVKSKSALGVAHSMLRHYHNEARQSITELQRPYLAASFSSSLRQALEPLCQGVAVQFDIAIADHLPPLAPDQLHQTLRIAQEALRNALQHASPNLVSVTAHRTGSHLVLEVADDGIGFEPGSGPTGHFGLEIMKDRARKIGASLNISTQKGCGTRVQLTLPADDRLEPIKVLLVEDQRFVRLAVRSLLEEQGAQPGRIFEAATGKEALALVEKETPDIAIVDLRLPDISGIEVIQTMRAAEYSFPIIVFSDYEGGEHIRSAIKSGATAYVTKDSAAELPAAIRGVMSGGRYFPKSFAGLLDKQKLRDELDPQERDVLEQLVSGLGDHEIAYRLGVSVKMVRQQIERLLIRWNATDRNELLHLTSLHGVVQSGPVTQP